MKKTHTHTHTHAPTSSANWLSCFLFLPPARPPCSSAPRTALGQQRPPVCQEAAARSVPSSASPIKAASHKARGFEQRETGCDRARIHRNYPTTTNLSPVLRTGFGAGLASTRGSAESPRQTFFFFCNSIQTKEMATDLQ